MIATNVRTLGAIVRQRRKTLALSQDKLAALAGVSRPWLSAFEAGKASVEIGLVFAVLDALGMHVDVTSSSASRPGTARAAAHAAAPIHARKSSRSSVLGSKSSRASKSGAETSHTSAAASKPTRNDVASANARTGAAADGARNARPPITMAGKPIVSGRARGKSAKEAARPASSRVKKK